MYFIRLTARPSPEHEDVENVSEAFFQCWINYENEKQAVDAALGELKGDHWEIIEVEEVVLATRDEFDEEDLQYFDQALVDQEVYVAHVCPRHPVYYLRCECSMQDSPESVEAEVWIVNEALVTDRDPFSNDFWSDELVEMAQDIARQTLSEEQYPVLQFLEHGPCCRRDFEDSDRLQFYDEAEEHGLCICIADQDPDEE